MRIIEPYFEVYMERSGDAILKSIELYGRICYKSESVITEVSAEPFVRKLIKSGHESVIEHEKITVKIVCDRGVSHEIVRHRIASYSQESTRYCNYTKDKFGSELTFIKPCYWDENSEAFSIWLEQMRNAERGYVRLLSIGVSPEQARSILPSSLKTEIVITMNLRQWRHFFVLRVSKRAHPQMREISIPLLKKMKEYIPAVFEDIVCE